MGFEVGFGLQSVSAIIKFLVGLVKVKVWQTQDLQSAKGLNFSDHFFMTKSSFLKKNGVVEYSIKSLEYRIKRLVLKKGLFFWNKKQNEFHRHLQLFHVSDHDSNDQGAENSHFYWNPRTL